MILKRVGPVSAAKVVAASYALLGLLIGAIVALVSLVASGIFPRVDTFPMAHALFGVGAVVILPICYGVIGFIVGLVGSSFYNLAAGMTGGVELDLQ